MKTKLLLLNAPANCGKGELTEYISQHVGCGVASCKKSLHELVIKFFLIPEDLYYEIYEDRKRKENPLSYFRIPVEGAFKLEKVINKKIIKPEDVTNGYIDLSIRQAMIYVSEVVTKPNFGRDYFGKARAFEIEQLIEDIPLWVDDSSAFPEELPPVVDLLGQENIMLIRIHRTGFTFEGDSRDYLPDGLIDKTIDINGDKGLDVFLGEAYSVVYNWCNE